MSIEPIRKAPELERVLENVAGRSTAIDAQKCVPFPIGCGKLLKESKFAKEFFGGKVVNEQGPFFKDQLSAREYQLSGLCQDCQDSFFDQEDEF